MLVSMFRSIFYEFWIVSLWVTALIYSEMVLYSLYMITSLYPKPVYYRGPINHGLATAF